MSVSVLQLATPNCKTLIHLLEHDMEILPVLQKVLCEDLRKFVRKDNKD